MMQPFLLTLRRTVINRLSTGLELSLQRAYRASKLQKRATTVTDHHTTFSSDLRFDAKDRERERAGQRRRKTCYRDSERGNREIERENDKERQEERESNVVAATRPNTARCNTARRSACGFDPVGLLVTPVTPKPVQPKPKCSSAASHLQETSSSP